MPIKMDDGRAGVITQGGTDRWMRGFWHQASTIPTVTDDPQLELGPTEALELVERGAVLLDVREDDEWAAGHAPQARHIAMGRVRDEYPQLPSDTPIVCVCRSGGRSSSIAQALRGVGYDARNLTGGMTAWELCGLSVVDPDGGPGTVI